MINVINLAESAIPSHTDGPRRLRRAGAHRGGNLFAKMLLAAAIGAVVLSCSAHAQIGTTVTKPTIVLVHGAFADASGWEKVILLLQQDGYDVLAIENTLTSFDADVVTTKRALESQQGKVVLVGHSYGGAVITQAAAGNHNVKALVYVAAFAPAAGEKIGQFQGKFPSELGAALKTDKAGFVTVDRSKFPTLFAGDLPIQEASVMAAAQKPIIGTAFAAKVSSAAWNTVPSWYMVAKSDRAINPELERFYARRMKAETVEIESSHVPFVSHPEEVTRLIEKAAAAISK